MTYDDDMGRDPQALPRFYQFIKEGKLPQTSQINEAEYEEFFESLLQQGDVLHIAFTSGQSGSVYNAFLAAEMLKEKYPDRKLVVLDSLCSSSGYGLLVDTVADMRDAGATLDEAVQWVLDNRNKVHHQFFSTDMTQFRRTGRVSGAAAAIATVLNICPLMRLDGASTKPSKLPWTPWRNTPRAAGSMTSGAGSAIPSARSWPSSSPTRWGSGSPM